MYFIIFIIGAWFGFGVCAIFSARAYDKGFSDAKKGAEK